MKCLFISFMTVLFFLPGNILAQEDPVEPVFKILNGKPFVERGEDLWMLHSCKPGSTDQPCVDKHCSLHHGRLAGHGHAAGHAHGYCNPGHPCGGCHGCCVRGRYYAHYGPSYYVNRYPGCRVAAPYVWFPRSRGYYASGGYIRCGRSRGGCF